MSMEETEKQAAEAAAKGMGVRVSLADIEGEIVSRAFMSGAVFLSNAEFRDSKDKVVNIREAEAMTLCLVTLKNGWMVLGKSSPADPANFDKELGKKISYADCVRQVWPLLGYQLKEQLHNTA